jgi:Protein of unknown function (DUF3551)
MKALLVAIAIVGAVGTFSTRAQAQNYPWCAYYSGGFGGGGTNCGFTTREQCMATVSGIGGFCDLNTQYVPPAGSHAAPASRRHHRYATPY